VVDESSSKNNHEQSGEINLRYDSSDTTSKVGMNANVMIELEKCGNFYPLFGLKLISIEDSSNSFELEIDVTYMISNILD
jgi:hypothetical protein